MRIILFVLLGMVVRDLHFARAVNATTIDFAYRYFTEHGASKITSALCWDEGNILLYKKFSRSGIQMNSLDPSNFDGDVLLSQLTSKHLKLGIVLDLACGGTAKILQIAHQNDLFIQTKSLTVWLLLLDDHLSEESLSLKAGSFQPKVSDPVQYLVERYQDTNNSELLTSINLKVNAGFIEQYSRVEKPIPSNSLSNASNLDAILPLNMLLDNQVLLAVPGITELYHLYAVNRVTKESKMKISKCGTVRVDGSRAVVRGGTIPARNSLEGAVLRGVTAIYSPGKFTSLDDLSTRDIDAWTKMSFDVFQLLKDDLNFSIIVRVFDDYGWMKNNSFSALMGHLEKREADLSVACILFRNERYKIVDYLNSPFRLQTGILFREPSLSSVSNIFLMPFSSAVWISIIAMIALMVIALACETAAGRRYQWLDARFTLIETVFVVLAAAEQQGHHPAPTSTTGRLIFLLVLFASLALFTSFSAQILSVMQAFSSSVLTIKDMTRSNFQVGIQSNFPLFDVAIKESKFSNQDVKEFYAEKILKRTGSIYFAPKDGIEKIRRGLFAYEVDLTVGYKLISDTYEELDKCGLKEIEAFPKLYLGTGLPKNSPFRELFRRRLVWLSDVGLIDRVWKRWIPQKPTCRVERIGFISAGFTECYSAIMFFLYGLAVSVSFFFIELVYYRIMKQHYHF